MTELLQSRGESKVGAMPAHEQARPGREKFFAKNLFLTDPPISTDIELYKTIWKNKKTTDFYISGSMFLFYFSCVFTRQIYLF